MGPKGQREEVLHANDPRHSDNIAPALLKVIQGAPGGLGGLGGPGGKSSTVLSALATGGKGGDAISESSSVARLLAHDKSTQSLSPLTRYLIGSPATVSSLISELSKEAEFESVTALRELQVRGAREFGGPVSSNSAYRVNERGPELLQVAGKQYLMTGSKSGDVKPAAATQERRGDININMTFAPGTDKTTLEQAARMMAVAAQRATARGTA